MADNSHPGRAAEPRKRPTQARARDTVDAIVAAAAHIFGQRGYQATTTNHIADAAGVSIGSLYQYFPNKDALLVEIEQRHLDDARRALDDLAASWAADPPGPRQWSESLVGTLVAINDAPFHRVVYEASPPVPRLADTAQELVSSSAAAASEHLRRWGAGPDHDLNAEVAVTAAVRLVHDLVVTRPAGAERNAVVDAVVSFVAAAVTPVPDVGVVGSHQLVPGDDGGTGHR